MSAEKCTSCGADIPEGRRFCPVCEALITGDTETAVKALCEMLPAEHGEILKAMFEKVPVHYDGINYGCISAFTIRTRIVTFAALPQPYIFQVELMSARANSVINADPKKIKILWRGKQ